MDPFVDVFVAVDADRSGRITRSELERYAKENNLDVGMVDQWLTLFDPEHTGAITLEIFCEKLGLKPADIIQREETHRVNAAPALDRRIRVIQADMPIEQQVRISTEALRWASELNSKDEIKKLSEDLKGYLDSMYGHSWQVSIVDGSYAITYTHLPGTSFQFAHDGLAFIMWRVAE
ncbi:unnamed protein product [Dicrocoelium dendriticum]|nr:unnamed protein product [Dicrocoelium dendriticum]